MAEKKSKLVEIKTKETAASVEDFINTVADEQKRKDSFTILEMMKKASGEDPKMWGSSIIGFGNKRYKSPTTGREVDWVLSPQKLIDLWMKTGKKMTDLIHMEFFKFPPQAKFLALLLFLSVSGNLLGQTPAPIRALIVDGFSNHDWKQTTLAIRTILEQSGRFEVEVSTIPGDSLLRKNWKLNTTGFDLIIQNTNNIHNTALKWPKVAQESLENFVKAGGGLYILHSANNAFPDWVEYNNMIGLGWREAQDGIALEIEASTREIIVHPAGEGKGTSHGDRFDALIQILNRHPINEGFPDAWKTKNTEVYSFPRGPAQNLTILSYAFDSTDTQSYWPVEWLVDYGKGRVYNSSMGHLWHGETFPLAYQCVGFQTTVIRAAEWLATGLVTFSVPVNFPTDKESSLKPEMDLNLRKND